MASLGVPCNPKRRAVMRPKTNFKLNQSILCWLPRASLGLLAVLAFLTVCPIDNHLEAAHAEESGAGTYAALATPTVTLSLTDSISKEINPTMDGTFQSLTAAAKVEITNADSYSVAISGNPEMSGQKPDNKTTIKPVTANTTPDHFANNTWGYSFVEGDNITPDEDTSYNPVSADSTTLVDQATVTDGSISKTYTLAFGAKINSALPADTYTSNVVLSVVATPKEVIEYTLNYNANGGRGTANPASQSESSQAETHEFIVAAQGTMVRTGYTFLGWADTTTATTAQYTAGSSKITLTKATPTKTLYAVWKSTVFNGITTMQEMTSSICKSAKENDSATLKDTRDNKTYKVTKLKDGNCWMTQNMDYDITGKTLSVGTASSSDNGNVWDDGNTTNGNYYQFSTAAVACNLGGNWQLPTSGGNTGSGSFRYLTNTYGITSGASNATSDSGLLAAPLSFIRSGYINYGNGQLTYVGSFGYYWSSTEASSSNGCHLDFYSSFVGPASNRNRAFGYSVRCLVLGQ